MGQASPASSSAGGAGSRRNSESVIQSAVAIAAAVPKLKLDSSVTTSGATATASASSVPDRLRGGAGGGVQMSASAENLAKSGGVGGISVSVVDGGSSSSSRAYELPKKTSPFPFDSYHGLQEATARRVKRFEDETARAMMLRSSLQSAAASLQAVAAIAGEYESYHSRAPLLVMSTAKYFTTAEAFLTLWRWIGNKIQWVELSLLFRSLLYRSSTFLAHKEHCTCFIGVKKKRRLLHLLPSPS